MCVCFNSTSESAAVLLCDSFFLSFVLSGMRWQTFSIFLFSFHFNTINTVNTITVILLVVFFKYIKKKKK